MIVDGGSLYEDLDVFFSSFLSTYEASLWLDVIYKFYY